MKTPGQIAGEIVKGLHFTSNRVVEGVGLVGEQHFAAEAIAKAISEERQRATTALNIFKSLADTPWRQWKSRKAIHAELQQFK